MKAKWIFGLSLVLALPFARTGALAADPGQAEEKEVIVSVSDAYIPSGFDTGSDAFVVVNGLFPNGCYRWKGSKVANVDDMTHEIRSFATVNQGMCIAVLVPYTQEVRLGALKRGSHVLHFMNGDGTYLEKKLTIE